jgi:CHAT domain-containing protein/Flp pilus assembly protein TadD
MLFNFRRLPLPVLTIATFGFISSIYPEIHPSIAIEISQTVNVNHNILKLNEEGNALFRSGKYRDAISIFRQTLSLSRSNQDRHNEATALNNLGMSHDALSEYQTAIEYYEESLAISRKLSNRVGEIIVLNNLGSAHNNLGQYQKAIEHYQQSLAISKAIGDRRKQGITLNNLGVVSSNLGQYQKAIEYYQQSLAISKVIGDRAGAGNTLNNLGAIQDNLGQYQKAIEYYQQSLVISKAIGDLRVAGITLNNLGVVSSKLGQYQKAIEYYQQSLVISQEIGHRAGAGNTLNNLGDVNNTLGQYQKAIEYYQQALIISQEIGDRETEGITLSNLGVVRNNLGQYQKAIEYYQQSLVIRIEIGDRKGEGITLNNLGEGYRNMRKFQQAIEYFQQALIIIREIGNREGEGVILNNLGSVRNNLGQYQKAIEYYQQALVIRRQIGDRTGEGITLHNLGYSLHKLKKLATAELTLRQAIEIWESLRAGLSDPNKISLADKVAETYQLLQEVLVEQNKTESALAISERARARSLVELLASKINTSSNRTTVSKIRLAPSLTTIKQIANQKNATLIQYSIIDDIIYIWVIQPNGKISFKPSKIPPHTKLQDLVVAARDSIGANRGQRNKDDEKTPPQANLQQLHQLLIAPIAAYLPPKPTDAVIILPQQELFSVPFAALQNAKGKYLIESHTLTIAPSIQVLGLTQSKPTNQQGNPLIVGNPIMPLYKGVKLANLAGAEREAQAIGQILHVQPLIGAAADKQQVIARMRQASLVHFATHGFFERVEGDLPGAIALTNGFLTSDEIFDLNLAADLVVLSACDTGRGNLTGDGVIGLSRSLVVAGVPSVVVSLWEVSDEATKVLMEEFYRQLSVNKLSKEQALRQAMLKTMREYENPNFWAAFMLVGEGK